MRCLVYRVTVSVFRSRHLRSNNCHCGNKQESSGQNLELSETTLSSNNTSSYNEVYDNPNYSHIMIGGQPFFILPSGELSEHVPVPASGETLTPRNVPEINSSQHHIYEGGSSTYRSTSDYDTDSSNFRHESDRASDSFPPIYEEIDMIGSLMFGQEGLMSPANVYRHQSLSPRPRTAVRPPPHNSMYYYSDTLKKRPPKDIEALQESDSGLSSRSGQNTSSESTPRHRAILNTSARRPRTSQTFNTQIVVKTTKKRDPIVNL